MALVPYEPLRHLSNIRREFDRLLSDFPSAFENSSIRVDVHETDTEVVATCDIPGLEKKEDIDIDVIDNNLLSISASISRTSEVKEENMHRKERYVGHIQRSISLPSPVEHEGVKASYRNGVLEVRMPKMVKDKKRIDIDFN
ncbi:Hsp20/alpha crystallin family protein [Peptococcaceae bacterium 1198_IL3148]